MVGIQAKPQEQPGELRHVMAFSLQTQGFPFSLGLEWKTAFQGFAEENGERREITWPSPASRQMSLVLAV